MSDAHRMRLRNGVQVVGRDAEGGYVTEATYGEYVLASDYDALAAELAQANRRIVAMGEMNNALKARLEAADLTIKAANDTLHGYRMADQKMAWDTACEILDSYSAASHPEPVRPMLTCSECGVTSEGGNAHRVLPPCPTRAADNGDVSRG